MTLHKHELVVDLFAGGGGASTGIFLATGRHPDVAVNHNPAALAVHAANHPSTRHEVEDVFDVHHKNHDRYDNRIENLEVLTHREHAQFHVRKHSNEKPCAMCGRTFTPAPTKRARAVCCSRYCFLLRATEHALEREERRRGMPKPRRVRPTSQEARA